MTKRTNRYQVAVQAAAARAAETAGSIGFARKDGSFIIVTEANQGGQWTYTGDHFAPPSNGLWDFDNVDHARFTSPERLAGLALKQAMGKRLTMAEFY